VTIKDSNSIAASNGIQQVVCSFILTVNEVLNSIPTLTNACDNLAMDTFTTDSISFDFTDLDTGDYHTMTVLVDGSSTLPDFVEQVDF